VRQNLLKEYQDHAQAFGELCGVFSACRQHSPDGPSTVADPMWHPASCKLCPQQGCLITQYATGTLIRACLARTPFGLWSPYKACYERVAYHVSGGVRMCRPMTSF
jgi:hypothetical protein